MSMYRIHLPITEKGGMLYPGSMVKREWSAEKREVLLLVGAVSPVYGPPLRELPGWKTRAETLAPAEIVRAEDFLDADEKTLAKLLNAKVDTIRKYKTELQEFWLTAPNGNG